MESDGDKEKFFNRAGQIAADKMSQTIDAATKLAGAEKGATKSHDGSGTSGRDDSTRATKDREKEPGSSFKNNVGKDKDDKKGGFFKGKGRDKSKFSGKLNSPRNLKAAWKKGGPVGLLIALLLLGGGGLMFGSQTMEPFAIVNRLMEEYNTMNLSNNMRFNRVWKGLARSGKIPQKVIDSLEKEGVTTNATKTPSGETEYTFEIDDGKGNKQTATADEMLEKTTFKDKLKSATKKTTGQYGGWYDRLSRVILGKRGISFDSWANWKDNPNEDQETRKKRINDVMENKNNSAEMDNHGGPVSDDEGKEHTDGEPTSMSTKEVRESISTKFKGIAASAMANVGVTSTCTVTMALTSIAGVVMTQQMADMTNLAMKFLEAAQKVQAGDGAESPIHDLMNDLNTVDEKGKSAMNSDGMAGIFGAKGALGAEGNVANANLETVLTTARAGGAVLESYGKCLGIQAGMSVVGLVLTFVPGIGWFGKAAKGAKGFTLLRQFLGKAWGEVLPMLAGMGIAVAVETAIEKGVEIYISNLASKLIGKDTGDYIVSGANQIMATNHKGSGGSPGSQAKVLAFQQQKQAALAEEADYDRRTKSPFDISSRYTFLGSIAYAMMPLSNAIMHSSLTETTSASQLALQNSLVALSPTAQAIATTDMITTKGNCPYLESVGAVGDMYCNPYFMTDTSTTERDIDEIKQDLYSWGDIDDPTKDAPVIQDRGDGENLKNFYKYCGNRASQYGLLDSGFAQDFQTKSGAGVLDFLLQFSDAVALLDSARQKNNLGWITGENCVANDENNFWNTRGKYYQRFLEDQRLIENLGVVDKSSLSDLIEKEENETPSDNSYEAQLARTSGMTKEQVTETLAYMDKLQFLANYDPSDLGPTPVQQLQQETYDFSSNNAIANINHDNPIQNSTNLAQHYVIYADLRTRTQVA